MSRPQMTLSALLALVTWVAACLGVVFSAARLKPIFGLVAAMPLVLGGVIGWITARHPRGIMPGSVFAFLGGVCGCALMWAAVYIGENMGAGPPHQDPTMFVLFGIIAGGIWGGNFARDRATKRRQQEAAEAQREASQDC